MRSKGWVYISVTQLDKEGDIMEILPIEMEWKKVWFDLDGVILSVYESDDMQSVITRILLSEFKRAQKINIEKNENVYYLPPRSLWLESSVYLFRDLEVEEMLQLLHVIDEACVPLMDGSNCPTPTCLNRNLYKLIQLPIQLLVAVLFLNIFMIVGDILYVAYDLKYTTLTAHIQSDLFSIANDMLFFGVLFYCSHAFACHWVDIEIPLTKCYRASLFMFIICSVDLFAVETLGCFQGIAKGNVTSEDSDSMIVLEAERIIFTAIDICTCFMWIVLWYYLREMRHRHSVFRYRLKAKLNSFTKVHSGHAPSFES